MRLYLSSFRLGDDPGRLLPLLAGGRSAVVIANAIDDDPPSLRRAKVDAELTLLRGLGLAPRELDLRGHFADPDPGRRRLAGELAGCALVWLRGGNAFLLRAALALSGADRVLTGLLARDALACGGYSAGPCVLSPSLRGLETTDDPDVVPATYGVPPSWDGLGVVPYAIVPHVDSILPGSEELGRLADRYRAEGVPHRCLRDGEVIVVDGRTAAAESPYCRRCGADPDRPRSAR